ncbi:hypothetical protein [Nocardia heshunensis]
MTIASATPIYQNMLNYLEKADPLWTPWLIRRYSQIVDDNRTPRPGQGIDLNAVRGRADSYHTNSNTIGNAIGDLTSVVHSSLPNAMHGYAADAAAGACDSIIYFCRTLQEDFDAGRQVLETWRGIVAQAQKDDIAARAELDIARMGLAGCADHVSIDDYTKLNIHKVCESFKGALQKLLATSQLSDRATEDAINMLHQVIIDSSRVKAPSINLMTTAADPNWPPDVPPVQPSPPSPRGLPQEPPLSPPAGGIIAIPGTWPPGTPEGVGTAPGWPQPVQGAPASSPRDARQRSTSQPTAPTSGAASNDVREGDGPVVGAGARRLANGGLRIPANDGAPTVGDHDERVPHGDAPVN